MVDLTPANSVFQQQQDDGEEEEEEINEIDCLVELLGGLNPQEVPSSAWDNPEIIRSDDQSLNESTSFDSRNIPKNKHSSNGDRKSIPLLHINEDNAGTMTTDCHALDDSIIFSKAYSCSGYCTPNGKVDRPPVKLVKFQDRGHGLVATRDISKGEVIFTEGVYMGCQLLSNATLEPDDEVGDNDVGGSSASINADKTNYAARACQNCFRSLEPISKCRRSTKTDETLPLPHLWPIPDFDFEQASEDKCRRDKYGRLQCQECPTWFCNSYCRDNFQQSFGDCCRLHEAAVLTNEISQEAAVVWATRMFVHEVEHFRRENGATRTPTAPDGLCGNANELTVLDLGVVDASSAVLDTASDQSIRQQSLAGLYAKLSKLLSLSDPERAIFNCKLLELRACQAARNGIAVWTQSPFKAYYAALLRNCGRGSDRHQNYLDQIARVLATGPKEEQSARLTRGLDRQIDQLVAVEIVAVCLLTARLNHSCDPSAQIVSQEFIDAHIDVLATRNISRGEEITISYINPQASTARRRRELEAKYLFKCNCLKCRL